MTVNELVEKLEQVRNFIEDSKDDNVRQAFDDVNLLISDLENDGIRTIALFDEVAFATGDQTTVLCISYAYDSQDRSRAEHKNISFADSFSSLYLEPDGLRIINNRLREIMIYFL